MAAAKANNCLSYWRAAASCIMGFFGFLRVSEVTALRMSDLKFTFKTIEINVRTAKRRPDGFQAIIALDNIFASFVEEFWSKYNIPYSSQFSCFPQITGNKFKPLAAGTIQKDLKSLMRLLNMPLRHFAFHSCKLGGTTKATEAGINTSDIVDMGHWRSRGMVDRYSRASTNRLSALSKQICDDSFDMT